MCKRKYDAAHVKAEMRTWGKKPVLNNLSEKEQKTVRSRILAIEMYADNFDMKTIEERTGITSRTIIRLFEKAMSYDETGDVYGYNALIPYNRKGTSKNKIQPILEQYPGLEEKILNFYFNLRPGRAMKRPDKKTTHEVFLSELANLGHDTSTYPFNLTDGGLRVFSSWLDRKEAEKALYLARQSNDAKTEDSRTGTQTRLINPARPYEVIEIDGHRLDLIYVVTMTDKDGNEYAVPVERPWLLAAIDVATRSIVSYRLVFSTEYSSIDVMKLIESVTIPYIGRPGIREDGMPSQVFEEVRYAMPELIMLDNALAHYANDIIDKVSDFGYQFMYGPVSDPTKRPHIERFFSTFEKKWGHKLPSTTGSNPGDLVRLKAEEDAVRFRFTRDKVEQLVDIAITTYNNSEHRSLGGMTPLGKMRQLINTGYIPNRLAPSYRPTFKLFCKRKATFRGNKKTGKHVYVQINNFVYTSDTIGRNYNLVGNKVTLCIDPDNISVIHAYSERDTYIGPLFVKGNNVLSQGGITMKQGKEAHAYLKEKGIKPTYGLDDVKRYILELEKHPVSKTNLRKVENIKVNMPDISNERKEEPKKEQLPDNTEIFDKVEIVAEKNLSFDERKPEERRAALRKKYEHRYIE